MATGNRTIIPLRNPHLPQTNMALERWATSQATTIGNVIRRCLYDEGRYEVAFPVDKTGATQMAQVIAGHLWYADAKRPTGGPERADVMIIGKCASREDIGPRRLYSGDTGEVLLRQLLAAGFARAEIPKIYLSTVLATEPLEFGKSSLPAMWLEDQRMLLMQQLLLVRPRICLLQGVEAVKAVLGKSATLVNTEATITERTFDCSIYTAEPDLHTIMFVTSINPAAVVYDRSRPGSNSKYRTSAEQRMHKQLKYFCDVVRGENTVDADFDFSHTILDDSESLEAALVKMRAEAKDGLVAWDAEWQGAHPQNLGAYIRCIQFAFGLDHGYVIALTHPGGAPRFRCRDADGNWTTDVATVKREVSRLCKDYMKGLRVVGHYFTADMEWLLYYGLDLRDEYDAAPKPSMVKTHGGFATDLAAHAWDETQLFSLDDQLAMHSNFPRYSTELHTFKKTAKADVKTQLSEDLKPYRTALSNYTKARKDLAKLIIEYGSAQRKRRGIKLTSLVEKVRATRDVLTEQERIRDDVESRYAKRLVEMEDGYGWIPDDILYKYGAYDAASELDLANTYLTYLEADRFGNRCFRQYWIAHRAALAALEINCTGLIVDRAVLDEMSLAFAEKRDALLAAIRKDLNWQDFNPRSRFEFAEAIFGEEFNGMLQQYGKQRRLRPKGAKTIRAVPLRTTGKYPVEWEIVRHNKREFRDTPSTSKQTLGEMFFAADKLQVRRKCPWTSTWRIVREDHSRIVGLMRDYRYMDQALKSLMREPSLDEEGEIEYDDDGNVDYEKGIATLICADGRVRPRCRQTVETGRWALRDPNLMACAKNREGDFSRIFGSDRNVSVRSIFRPVNRDEDSLGEDWFFVESDLSGAELLMMGIAAQDVTMIDHCLRNQLPEDDPDFFDTHSNTTVTAFKFDCEPTKKGLKSIGKLHLRTVGKSVAFGVAYGRGARAIAIALRQEGVYVSVEECQAMIDAFFRLYPDLFKFLQQCKKRASNPQWLCNLFGCYRRFPFTKNQSMIAAFEREAMNAPIQGGVAYAMSLASRNVIDYRNTRNMRFQLTLQIHDALKLHVPASELEEVVRSDGVLKSCMVHNVPLRPRDLDGRPLLGAETYYFGSSIDVYDHWGQVATVDRFLRNGIRPELGGWSQTDEGLWRHEEFEDRLWSEASNGFVLTT